MNLSYRRDDPRVPERIKTIGNLIDEYYGWTPSKLYYTGFWCARHDKPALDHALEEFQHDLQLEQRRVNAQPLASRIRETLKKMGFQEGSDYELLEFKNKFGKHWQISCPADGESWETLVGFLKHAKRYGPADWAFLREAEGVSKYYSRGR